MTKKQKTIAIVLFICGTLFFGAAFSIFKDGEIGAGIFSLALAAGCFIVPVRRILDHINQKKSNGQNWIAMPAVAISIPLLFGCIGLTNSNTEKNKKSLEAPIETSIVETELSQTSVGDEPTTEELTPSPSPTEEAIATEELTTSTTTSTEQPTMETTKETTKETKEIPKETTKAPKKETKATTTTAPVMTEAPAETPASSAESSAETAKPTEAPAVVVPKTEATTVAVVSEAKDYVLNNNRMKFHKPSCYSVKQIADHNREDRHCTREELINAGYEPCGNCHP